MCSKLLERYLAVKTCTLYVGIQCCKSYLEFQKRRSVELYFKRLLYTLQRDEVFESRDKMTVTTASVLLVAILNFLKEVITVSTTLRFKLLVQIWCQMLHQLSFNIFTTTFSSLTLPYLLGGGYDLITTEDVGAQLHYKRNSPLNCLFCSFSLQLQFYNLP